MKFGKPENRSRWMVSVYLIAMAGSSLAIAPVAADHTGLNVGPDATAGPASIQWVHTFTVENPETGSGDHAIDTVRFSVDAGPGPALSFRAEGSTSQGPSSEWDVESGTTDGRHWLEFRAPLITQALQPGTGQDFTIEFDVVGNPSHGSKIPIQVDGSSAGALTMQDIADVHIDARAPRVLFTEAHDQDRDGFIDAFNVTFDEPVDSAALEADHWSIAGLNASSIQPGGQGLVESAWITFDRSAGSDASPDTGALPALSYAGTSLVDRFGNVRGSLSGFTQKDAAPPVPMKARTHDMDADGRLDHVEVLFSEDLHGTTSAQDWGLPPPFAGSDGHAVGITWSNGQARVTIALNASRENMDTASTPEVIVSPGGLRDVAGNPVEGVRITPRDGVAPHVINVTTQDTDIDGHIDALLFEFSEPMNAVPTASFGEGETVVAPPILFGTGVTVPADPAWTTAQRDPLAWSGVVGEDSWLLAIKQGPIPDTDATPEVSYTSTSSSPGDLVDLNGNRPHAFENLTASDGAAPILLRADAIPETRGVDAWFSEVPVGSGSGGTIRAQDFAYDDASSGGATAIANILDTPGSKVLAIRLDSNVDLDDIGNDAIMVTGIRDQAGNSAPSLQVLGSDTEGPEAPTNLVATPLTRTTARIAWNTPEDFDTVSFMVRLSNETLQGQDLDAIVPITSNLPAASVGQRQSAVLSDLAPDTEYHLVIQVVDRAGNNGTASEVISFKTPLDTTPPTMPTTITSSSHPDPHAAYQNNTPAFTWEAVDDPESDVTYLLAITNSADPVAPADGVAYPATTWGPGLTIPDGTWYFHVRAASAGGAANAESVYRFEIDTQAPAAVTAIAVIPGITNATVSWLAPGDDGTNGTATAYAMRWRTEGPFENEDHWDQAEAFAIEAAPEPAGKKQQVTVTGLEAAQPYWIAVRAIDDAGNVGPWSSTQGFTTGQDPSPPSGELNITSDSHAAGVPSDAETARFAWNPATDPESPVTYYYALTNRSDSALSASDNQTTSPNATIEDLADGTWFFHVQSRSKGGWGQQATFPVEVIHLEPQAIRQWNEGLQVTATQEGKQVRVSWRFDDSSKPPTEVYGIQIWGIRGQKVELVADVDRTTSAFHERAMLLDASTEAQGFAATAYFGKTETLGYRTEGGQPELELLDVATIGSGPDSIPWWIWAGSAAFGAGIVVAVIAIRSGRRPDTKPDPTAALARELAEAGIGAPRSDAQRANPNQRPPSHEGP